MSSDKFPSQRHSYSKWCKKLHRKFPTTADALASFIYPRIARFDYGVLTLKNGVLAPRHANYQAVYNQCGRYRKLTKSDMMCHFVGRQHSDKLWYTSEPFRTSPYGNTYVLVVLDFDNKTKGMSYAAFKSLVVAALQPFPQLASCWMNPSTNGNGVHLHVALEMVYEHKADICAAILSLQRTLKNLLQTVGFDIIAGSPAIFEEASVEKSGKLALLPLLKDDSEAAAYLKQIKQPVSLSLVLQQARVEEEKRTVTDCGLTPVAPSRPQDLEEASLSQEGEEKRTVTDCGLTPLPSPQQQTLTEADTGQEHPPSNTVTDCGLTLLVNLSPNERMIWCCQQLARKLKRMPIPQELVKEYEDLGLNTGEDNGRRMGRAIEAIEYCGRTFNPRKTGPEFDKGKALNLLRSLGVGDRKLNLEKTAEQMVYFTAMIGLKHDNPLLNGTVSSVQARKKLGVGKEQYLAAKDLLAELNLIVPDGNGYRVGGPKHGISKKYKLGENHPLK